MGDKKTKVNCNLVTRGAHRVNKNVISDLMIPDPELNVGKRIITEELDKETESGDQTGNS